MKLAKLAFGMCAAAALVVATFDADAKGRGGGGRSGGKSHAGGHVHHYGHHSSRVFIGGAFVAWPMACGYSSTEHEELVKT